jgi:hypothetical protein
MTQQELKDLIRRSNEQPLRIHLADGASYKVDHPDFAFTTSGSVILASGPGHHLNAEFVVCPLAHITRVEVMKKTKARAA